jgi:cell wall assembly regulator SMI1
MTDDTWNRLEQKFVECPQNRARDGAEYSEIEDASRQIGVTFNSDYAEFINRYGGASIGAYEIAGLRRAEYMSSDAETVLDLTRHFQEQRWPGTENWIVFSTDQGGNPIGLDKEGMVWLSDHDSQQIVAICQSFEEFLRTWCLSTEPEAADYYDEQPWPSGN